MLGDDDLSYAEFVDIESQHATFTGTLHYGETKESVYYYTTSGSLTHDYNNSNSIWINKTGGGNFTISFTNVPTDGAHAYGMTVAIKNAGGEGIPTSVNVNGQGTTIYWSGGNEPAWGDDDNYVVVSFALVYTPNTNQHSFTIFGSATGYYPA